MDTARIPSSDLPQVSVLIPTYEEAENIESLIERLSQVFQAAGLEHEVIVIDDNSPDGTATRAEAMTGTMPVRVLRRTGERCLSTAVLAGINNARANVCLVMDADFSHPVEAIPAMIRPVLDRSYDAAVGSRYMPGGGCDDWSWVRIFASRLGGFLAAGLTRLSDPMSGFMAFRKDLLRDVELRPVGWKIVLEIITRTNAHFVEVPIVFAERKQGKSKFTARVQLQYLHHLFRLYDWQLPTLFRFIKFCLVGLSGLVIDTLALISLVEILGIRPQQAAVLGFFLAVSWNYMLNRQWTFNYGLSARPKHGYLLFVAVCALGLLVRISIMHALLAFTWMGQGMWYVVASFLGVLGATIFNFLGSKNLVFRA